MLRKNRSLSRARAGAACFALTAAAIGIGFVATATAQDDVEELEELKAEREEVQRELADQALKVDATTADFEDVVSALDDINALVDLQEARLNEVEQELNSARAEVLAAQAREDEIAEEIEVLNVDLGNLAVASFTGERADAGTDLAALLASDNPSRSARRRTLIEFQTGSLGDGIDRLRALVAEAEVVSARRQDAVAAAEAGQLAAQQRQGELDAAYDAQALFVVQAEQRLEARLAEAAIIESRDAGIAAEISRQEEAIATRIRREAAIRAAEIAAQERASRPPVATPADITSVRGIEVHRSIAGRVEEMLGAAAADGVALSGWGFRNNIEQIALRQAHCGTSEFDIWEKSASACSPPTARPGQSQHERGLAIDFTYNGGSMTSRSNPGFVWLAANAHRWGFVNLPSEPWHWSTTGN